jgi:hypothetical protein
MSNKNYTNRTTCNQHEDCQENEYCDQFGYCWWCSEYDAYCDSIDSHCPSYCSEHGMNGDCPECSMFGDVNQDGVIDVLDVVMMVGAVLGDGTNLDASQFYAADVNGDGQLNVNDIVLLVQTLMARRELTQEQATEIINKLKFGTQRSKIRGGTGGNSTLEWRRRWKRRKRTRPDKRGR